MNNNVKTHPVMNLPETVTVFDLTGGYDPAEMTRFIDQGGWGVGGYAEKRQKMYLAPQYENRRNIHMGIDIWTKAGRPVFAVTDATVAYTANHDQEGNYGGTIVLKHQFEGEDLFALYGHLSLDSLDHVSPGQTVKAGEIVGWLGEADENGNWPPHLHYQLSRQDPGRADMPGVVSGEELEEALRRYPDPRILLGKIY